MFDMLSNIIKNLVSKPATRRHPYEKREPFKNSRGKVEINVENCIFCGICSRKCPSEAITVSRGDRIWEIDPFKCIVCGACEEACPKKCLFMDGAYKAPAYSKESIRHVQQVQIVKEGA